MNPFVSRLTPDNYGQLKFEPHPKRWRSFCAEHDLQWQAIPFRNRGGAALPRQAGFYCFYVGEPPLGLPQVLYPLYAGETVDLRRRYGDYLREGKRPSGRPAIQEMLHIFADEVAFAFALFDGDEDERLRIEKRLNDALMPCYGTKDFSAEVKRGRRPWAS